MQEHLHNNITFHKSMLSEESKNKSTSLVKKERGKELSDQASQNGAKLETLSILLIDDDADVLGALRLILSAQGHMIFAYKDSNEATTFLKSNYQKIDVVLCDMMMSPIDGFETLKNIRHISKDIPFIMMSANATKENLEKAQALGSVGFIEKPLVHLSLTKLLNDHKKKLLLKLR
jgi:CheY-like chemotaxis protein